MRSASLVIAGFVAAAVTGLSVAAWTQERPRAFTLGVAVSTGMPLPPRTTLCQGPISVPEGADFDGVTFAITTGGKPGPALDVAVRRAGAEDPGGRLGSALARASLPGGYPDFDQVPAHTVWFDRVGSGQTVAVCLRNRGARSALVFGDVDVAARTSTAYRDGEKIDADLALQFERREPRSLATLVPAMLDRAALFRARWTGAWTYWLLGALVLLAVPALLTRALRDAARDAA